MLRSAFLLLSLLSLSHCALSLQQSAPLLAWGASSLPADGRLAAMTPVDKAAEGLRAAYEGGILALFVADELSLEDLTAASTAFVNTRNACEGAQNILYMPNVHLPPSGENVVSAVSALAREAGATVTTVTASDVLSGAAELPKTEKNVLIVVHLPASAAHEECDTLVHQVSTHIAEARPAAELTAALTAVGQPQQLTRRLRSTEELVTAAAKAPRVGRARGAQGPNPVTQPDIPAYVALRPDQRHERALVWFSVPILMGIIVGLFMIVMFSVGIAGIMRTQTMERWPDASHDKNLIVPQ